MQAVPQEISSTYDLLAPSCYAGVPNQLYHALPGISSSQIPDILESPATYELRQQNPPAQTDAMLKGEVTHTLVLQPQLYEKNFKVSPTKTKGKAWAALAEKYPEHTIISPGMADDAFRMRDSLYANPTIRDLLEKNTEWREVSIWVNDPQTHLVCKIRPDMIVDGVIYDLKTTISPQWRAFKHSIWKWNYFISAPYYMDMARIAGLDIHGFRFIVVGNKPPHNTAIYELDKDWMDEGRSQYREALNSYWNYLMGDGWSGLPYGREIKTLSMGAQED